MYFIKPFDKKKQTKTKPSFYTITFSGFYHCHPQALQAKTKKKTPSKDLFKDKADFFFNLVNARTFWARLIWGVRCSNNVNFQWGCCLQSLELWHFMPAEKVGRAMTFGDTCWSVPESSFMDMPWIVFIYLFIFNTRCFGCCCLLSQWLRLLEKLYAALAGTEICSFGCNRENT